ncbi:molybdenum cofactor biosynthesis protein MoaE [Pelagovum pacificum]|uniref:Molybdopterin synthase catalytic subunit n=1 Tax=Pelagovum pacificum TaxID=2588711 RepID=A0A5C5GCE6_9RHOB|nr:molybdenum cofactor biosynthesis protein MoaE [Pelagovum pacificum]QQA42558.1 molybdenum cofactor biosynthesis protein MoaE [Pelagovum pacificum]TNY31642.1 molybdenum cofactor biosynthesis protein MoaE [Pelagovum pacificum]
MQVRVQADPFDAGAELNAFTASVDGAGAVVSFSGIVRDVSGGLAHMEIEHYPGMTERAIRDMVGDAMTRFSLVDALVIHRYGRLGPNELIMMVCTAAPHRGDAFLSAEFLMDFLKSRAPFWKKEVTADGEDWVASKSADEDALSRW